MSKLHRGEALINKKMNRSDLSGINFFLSQVDGKLNNLPSNFEYLLLINISLNDELQIFIQIFHHYIELIIVLHDLMDSREIFYFRMLHCC